MTRKTPEQKIATLEAQLARAKEAARKKRTRRLIELGATLEPLAERLEALTKEQRAMFMKQALTHFNQLANPQARPTPTTTEHQGD